MCDTISTRALSCPWQRSPFSPGFDLYSYHSTFYAHVMPCFYGILTASKLSFLPLLFLAWFWLKWIFLRFSVRIPPDINHNQFVFIINIVCAGLDNALVFISKRNLISSGQVQLQRRRLDFDSEICSLGSNHSILISTRSHHWIWLYDLSLLPPKLQRRGLVF